VAHKVWSINHGGEYWTMREDGAISRPKLVPYDVETWHVVGAVRFNNFGSIAQLYSLDDIKTGNVGNWQYRNGKQRIHVIDFDHGSRRTWMSPNHSVTA
jgi:hypothetical protein